MTDEELNKLFNIPAVNFLRQSELIPAVLPFSASTLWRLVKSGEFPRPIKLSKRITAWRTEDIRAWLRKSISPELF